MITPRLFHQMRPRFTLPNLCRLSKSFLIARSKGSRNDTKKKMPEELNNSLSFANISNNRWKYKRTMFRTVSRKIDSHYSLLERANGRGRNYGKITVRAREIINESSSRCYKAMICKSITHSGNNLVLGHLPCFSRSREGVI